MSWGSPLFVLAIIAMSTVGWVFTTAIRARHGYPVEGEFGGVAHKGEGPDTHRKIDLLSAENERLQGKIGRLEERIAVLERIATDEGARLSRDIEALR